MFKIAHLLKTDQQNTQEKLDLNFEKPSTNLIDTNSLTVQSLDNETKFKSHTVYNKKTAFPYFNNETSRPRTTKYYDSAEINNASCNKASKSSINASKMNGCSLKCGENIDLDISGKTDISFESPSTVKETLPTTNTLFVNISKIKSESNDADCGENISVTKEEFNEYALPGSSCVVFLRPEDGTKCETIDISTGNRCQEEQSSKDVCNTTNEISKEIICAYNLEETPEITSVLGSSQKCHKDVNKRSPVSKTCLFGDCGSSSSRKCFEYKEPQEPMFSDRTLPEGWSRYVVQRQTGKSAGKFDVYIRSPEGKRFRSHPELRTYLTSIHSDLNADDFNFSVTGRPKRTKAKTKQKKKKKLKGKWQKVELNELQSNKQTKVKKSKKHGLRELAGPSYSSPWSVFPLLGLSDTVISYPCVSNGAESEMYESGVYETESYNTELFKTEICETELYEAETCDTELYETELYEAETCEFSEPQIQIESSRDTEGTDCHFEIHNGDRENRIKKLFDGDSEKRIPSLKLKKVNETQINKNSHLTFAPKATVATRGPKRMHRNYKKKTVKFQNKKISVPQKDIDLMDEDHLFLQSILPSLKALPKSRKMFVKYKIQELLYNQTTDAENCNSIHH